MKNFDREDELLMYASVCFDYCTNPFESMHLIKKDVRAGECIDLSNNLCDIISSYLAAVYGEESYQRAKKLAEKEFKETQ